MITRLKDLRERHKITQGDLARTLQVSPSTVGMWEQGRREPDNETLVIIANYFGVTTDYLLGHDANEPTTVTPDEEDLLDKYRRLTPHVKDYFRGILSAIIPGGGQLASAQ